MKNILIISLLKLSTFADYTIYKEVTKVWGTNYVETVKYKNECKAQPKTYNREYKFYGQVTCEEFKLLKESSIDKKINTSKAQMKTYVLNAIDELVEDDDFRSDLIERLDIKIRGDLNKKFEEVFKELNKLKSEMR